MIQQVQTLLWLRYLLLVGSLRIGTSPWQNWLTGIGTFFVIVLPMAIGGGVFVALYGVVLPSEVSLVPLVGGIFWTVTWMQLFLTVIAQSVGTNKAFDPQRFLLYPIPLRTLFVLNFFTIYAEASCWFVLPTFVAVILAPTLYFGQISGWLLLILALAWVGGWHLTLSLGLARVLSQGGRQRELWIALGIGLLAVLPQIFLVLQQRYPVLMGGATQFFNQPWLAYLPPQALTTGVERLMTGESLVPVLGILLLWVVGLGLVSYPLFEQLALRVEGSSKKKSNSKQPSQLFLFERHWGLPNIIEAVFLKQLLYIVRNPLSYFVLLPTVIILVAIAITPRLGGGSFWIVIGLTNVFLLSAQFFNSTFAFDNTGFKTYILAPVPWTSILLGHNLAHGVWVLAQAAIGLFIIQLLTGSLTFGTLLLCMLVLVLLWIGYCVVGNWISILLPIKLEFGVQRRQEQRSIVLLILPFVALGLNVLLLIPIGLCLGLGYLLDNWLFGYGGLLLWVGLASLLYPAALRAQGRLLQRRQVQVLEVLVKP